MLCILLMVLYSILVISYWAQKFILHSYLFSSRLIMYSLIIHQIMKVSLKMLSAVSHLLWSVWSRLLQNGKFCMEFIACCDNDYMVRIRSILRYCVRKWHFHSHPYKWGVNYSLNCSPQYQLSRFRYHETGFVISAYSRLPRSRYLLHAPSLTLFEKCRIILFMHPWINSAR